MAKRSHIKMSILEDTTPVDYTDGLSDTSKEEDDKKIKEAIEEGQESYFSFLTSDYLVGTEDIKEQASKFFDMVFNFFEKIFKAVTSMIVLDIKTVQAAMERWEKLKDHLSTTSPYEVEIAKGGKEFFTIQGLDWIEKKTPNLTELQKAIETAQPNISKQIQSLPTNATTPEAITTVVTGSEALITAVKSMYDDITKAVGGWLPKNKEAFPSLVILTGEEEKGKGRSNGIPVLRIADKKDKENVGVTDKYYFKAGTKASIDATYIPKELTVHKAYLETANKVVANLERVNKSNTVDMKKLQSLIKNTSTQVRTEQGAAKQGTTTTSPTPKSGAPTASWAYEAKLNSAKTASMPGLQAANKIKSCVQSWQRPIQLFLTTCQKTAAELKTSFKVASAAMDHFSQGYQIPEEKKEEPKQAATASLGVSMDVVDDLLNFSPLSKHMTSALGGSYSIRDFDSIERELNSLELLCQTELQAGQEGFFEAIGEFFTKIFEAIGRIFDSIFGSSGGGGGGGSTSKTINKASTIAQTLNSQATRDHIEQVRRNVANAPDAIKAIPYPDPNSAKAVFSSDGLKKVMTTDFAKGIRSVLDDGSYLFMYVEIVAKTIEELKTELDTSTKASEITNAIETLQATLSNNDFDKLVNSWKQVVLDSGLGLLEIDSNDKITFVSSKIPVMIGNALSGNCIPDQINAICDVLQTNKDTFAKQAEQLQALKPRAKKIYADMNKARKKLDTAIKHISANAYKYRDKIPTNAKDPNNAQEPYYRNRYKAAIKACGAVKAKLPTKIASFIRWIMAPMRVLAKANNIVNAALKFISSELANVTTTAAGTASFVPEASYLQSSTYENQLFEDDLNQYQFLWDDIEYAAGLEDDSEFFLVRWAKWIWKKITDFFDWLFGSDSKEKDGAAIDKASKEANKATAALQSLPATLSKLDADAVAARLKNKKYFKGCFTVQGLEKAVEMINYIIQQVSTDANKPDSIHNKISSRVKELTAAIKELNTGITREEYEKTLSKVKKIRNELGSLNETSPEAKNFQIQMTKFMDTKDPKYYIPDTMEMKKDVLTSLIAGYSKAIPTYTSILAKCKVLDESLEKNFQPLEKALEDILTSAKALKIDPKVEEGYANANATDKSKDTLELHKKLIRRAFNEVKSTITAIVKLIQSASGHYKASFRKILNRTYSLTQQINALHKHLLQNEENIARTKAEKETENELNEKPKQNQGATQWFIPELLEEGIEPFSPGLLTEDIQPFEYQLEAFKLSGTEGFVDSVFSLLTGLANMVSRLFSTFKMVYRSFRGLKRTELHSYQEKYPASIMRVKRLSYQDLSDVDVPLPKGLKTTYQDALQKVLTVLKACDMVNRSKSFVAVARKFESQLRTGIDTRTTSGGLYTQQQEILQINNLFKKSEQCFDGTSASSKKFHQLFSSTEEFASVHDLLDSGCQYEYDVASVYSNLEECEKLMNESVQHAKLRKNTGSIPISKAELVSLSESCLFMAKTFDTFGLAIASFNKIEHNYVETLKSLVRQFNI